jgi:hypothetical protein
MAERAAALLAQAATFGTPADLHQDLEATTEELAALRAQVATVALMLADVGQPHPLRSDAGGVPLRPRLHPEQPPQKRGGALVADDAGEELAEAEDGEE